MRIRKAVLPVAGLGTRVLPASKVVPKELLPLVDKPTLQYIVEEAVAAGIEEFIFVTNRSKRGIEDHFDAFPELEQALERKGKRKELEELRHTQQMAKYFSVRQAEALGLGHAVLCARELVGDEPFVLLLGDNLIAEEKPCLPRMIELYEEYNATILSLFTVPEEQISAYGIVAVENLSVDAVKVTQMVEKPRREEAPSNLAVYGHYILTPDIFELIEKTPPGGGGEIWLTDALDELAREGRCYGLRLAEGSIYDTGTPLGLLTTSISLALKRPELAPALRAFMHQALKEEK